MQRGDVVVAVASGDYGKPRPAVIVQTDAIDRAHQSVIVCQITSVLAEIPDLRVTVEPDPQNGLNRRSQIMVDKPVTIRRDRVGQVIGRLDQVKILELNLRLAFVMGLAG